MIYLIDTIGNETGAHYYDEAFAEAFENKNIDVKILSNYKSARCIPLINNFYHSGKVGNIILLILSWFKLLWFYLNHQKDTFVYQSYGLRNIDIIFLAIFRNSNNLYTIVHDVFEITNVESSSSDWKFRIQKWVYQHWIRKAICHSRQTVSDLQKNCNYSGAIIFYPHFRYSYDKDYKLSLVAEDVRSSIKRGKLNLLFFGQLRLSKGVDVLIESFEYLKDNSDINIIVAGSDKGRMMVDLEVPENVVKILRYINDDELKFLFSNCDVMILPYKEIYQSGVLETVIHFEKFAIMSNIKTFKDSIEQYPSFGKIYSPNTGKKLAESILEINICDFNYSEEDKIKYEKAHDINILINQMGLCV